MCDEKWRWIEGYEGLYMVSDHGRILSTPKETKPYGAVMVQQLGQNGYLSINLCKDGAHQRKSVHRIVAEAFLENPDNLEQVNHKDGDKTNNRVRNLEWVTRSDNQKHAYAVLNRTRPSGGTPRPSKRKLTFEQAEEVRNSDKSQSQLAAEYGVTQHSIWCIKKGLTYKERA